MFAPGALLISCNHAFNAFVGYLRHLSQAQTQCLYPICPTCLPISYLASEPNLFNLPNLPDTGAIVARQPESTSRRGNHSPCRCVAADLFKIVHNIEAHGRKAVEITISVHLRTLIGCFNNIQAITYIIEKAGITALRFDLPHS